MTIDETTILSKNKIDIVFCIDNNYIMPCGITIISLLENNKENTIVFHIIGMDLSKESKEKLLTICSRYRNASIIYYDIKKESFDSHNFSLYNTKHLSLATYARLFMGDILPQNVEKILYLDCDIIVTDNLGELWNTNIENHSIAGVTDLHICYTRSEVFQNLDYPSTKQYINAGVLLINLKYWRDKNIVNTFLDFLKEKYDKLKFHDQDIINGTLYDSKLLLPIRYNILNVYYYANNDRDISNNKEEVYAALRNPAIIHFSSPEKPWLKLSMHPLTSEFIYYKNMSPWRDELLTWKDAKLSRIFRYYKRKALYTLKLKEPIYMAVSKNPDTGMYDIEKK